MASKWRTSDGRCGGAVNLASSPGTPAGHVRRREMHTIGPIPSPPLHPCPSGVSSECPPFGGSRRGPPCVEKSRPSPPPLEQSTRETPQACTRAGWTGARPAHSLSASRSEEHTSELQSLRHLLFR